MSNFWKMPVLVQLCLEMQKARKTRAFLLIGKMEKACKNRRRKRKCENRQIPAFFGSRFQGICDRLAILQSRIVQKFSQAQKQGPAYSAGPCFFHWTPACTLT